MPWSPSFNSFALDTTNGIALPDWKDHGPVNVRTEGLLLGGSGVTEAALLGRVVEARIKLSAADAATFETRLSGLLAELHSAAEASLKLDSTREILARAIPGKFTPTEGSDGLVAIIPVKWVAESPYWRSLTKTSVSSALVSPTALNITNNGDAPAALNFQLENTSLNDHTGITATVKNTTTGEEFRLQSIDIDAGDTLKLDEDGQLYFDNPVGAGSKTPIRVDGKVFDIAPGLNAITVTHTMGTDGTWTVAGFDRHHYHGAL
jgi:hypothetical protein